MATVDLSGNLPRMSGTEIMEANVKELLQRRARLDREMKPALGYSNGSGSGNDSIGNQVSTKLIQHQYQSWGLFKNCVTL